MNPKPQKAASVGDLFVTFGPAANSLPGRAEKVKWEAEITQPTWQLSFQSPSADWKGFPLTTVSVGGWRAWMLGELRGVDSGGDECARQLKELLLGTREVATLNGNFLVFAWNEEAGQWHVWTNRLGTVHAYYAESGGRAALSTFCQTASAFASRKKLDWTGLSGYFKFGFFPADRTFYEDVRILRPASHYVFDAHGKMLAGKRYWDWWHRPDSKRSQADTLSEFARIFSLAMADDSRSGRLALPISGGLDSRTMVAFFPRPSGKARQVKSPWSYSYGYQADSIETSIASQVAQCRALDFETFTIGPYLFDRLEHIMACVEGFVEVTQCRQAAIHQEISGHADYLLGGHLGDLLMDEIGLAGSVPTAREIEEHAVNKMAKRGGSWLLRNLCRENVGNSDAEAVVEELLRQELQPLAGIADPDFRVKCLKMDQWVFRWTNSNFRMFQSGAFIRLPFYDDRLIDLFCTIPTDMVSKRRLQIDYLKEYAPDLARVKWQAYDANLYHYNHSDSWLLPKRAVKKAWRLLTNNKVVERNWEVQFGGNAGRQGLDHWLLRPGLRLHDLVPKQKIQSLLQDFRAEPLKEGRGYTVSTLLTFSAWLEKHA